MRRESSKFQTYSIFVFICLFGARVAFAAPAANRAKYDCEKCETEPSRAACFTKCPRFSNDQAKWQACVKDCNERKTREGCLTSCYPTCENMSGGPMAAGASRGFAHCDRCRGQVILVQDEMASDGSRVQVCKGKLVEGK